jgi:regulatory protein YycH of two-component signal transduction system YycFG
MVKPSKAGIRRIHVARWTYEGKGFRKYLRPIYALGDKPNAPKETNATSLSNH